MAFVIQSEVNFRIRDLHLCSRGTGGVASRSKGPRKPSVPSRASFESYIYWPEPVHNVVLNHLGKLINTGKLSLCLLIAYLSRMMCFFVVHLMAKESLNSTKEPYFFQSGR